MVVYKRCALVWSETTEPRPKLVTWIPKDFAVVGKRIQIKHSDKWVSGLEVIEVYDDDTICAEEVRADNNAKQQNQN